MNRWKKVLAWVNRDEGKTLHVGKLRLNVFELLGYLLFLLSLVIYVLHDKIGFSATWIGWAALFAGAMIVAVSAGNVHNNDENE